MIDAQFNIKILDKSFFNSKCKHMLKYIVMFYWQFLKIFFSLVYLFWFNLAYCQMRVGGYLQISVFLAGGYQVKAYLSKCVTACCHIWLFEGPKDYILPGFSVHAGPQARILKRVAMPTSRGSYWCRNQTHVSFNSCIAGGFFTSEPLGKPCKMHSEIVTKA